MRTATGTLTIEHALLGFLYAGPVHGYEIYQQLSSTRGLWQVWRLKQSQLYALLAKLEKAHYITATLQPQDARPPRKNYQLTEAGRNAFEQWLHTPVKNGRQMRIEFLAKLYFTTRLDPTGALQLIDQQTAACQRWLAELRPAAAPQAGADYFGFAVQQFRLNQVESFLAWLATCRQALPLPDVQNNAAPE